MNKGVSEFCLVDKVTSYTEFDEAKAIKSVPLGSWTGLVVHIDNTLGTERRRDIEQALNSKPGVIKARFNVRRPHLLLVDYNQQQITSMEILLQIRRQSVQAQLVGPV